MPFPVAYVGRHPKPKDLLGKLLYGVGSVLRATGVALDSVGAVVQGSYGLKDERECWGPVGVADHQGLSCCACTGSLRA